METNVNNAAVENEQASALKIELDQHAEFNATADVLITTTTDECRVINSVFKQVFRDFYGTSLEVQFQSNLGSYIVVPSLMFRVLPESEYQKPGYYAFKTLSAQPSNDILGRVQRLSKISAVNGVKVDITEDGKSALSDFVLNIDKNDINKYDWNKSFDIVPNTTDTFIKVYKLDISKILKKIYGDKIDENGKERYYYQITPTYRINGSMQYKQIDNWAINILRLNQKNQNKALEELGYGVPSDAQGLANVVSIN